MGRGGLRAPGGARAPSRDSARRSNPALHRCLRARIPRVWAAARARRRGFPTRLNVTTTRTSAVLKVQQARTESHRLGLHAFRRLSFLLLGIEARTTCAVIHEHRFGEKEVQSCLVSLGGSWI
ncbi:hypothetical protein H671_2g5099 [Cricetulus griseus]|nr:hypothetical protein H671_2g5099 [Cricetulus griseus]